METNYSPYMIAENFIRSSIRDILTEYPKVIPVFIQLKTQCIGCAFERFCTLKDVAKHYEIQIDELVDNLNKTIAQQE